MGQKERNINTNEFKDNKKKCYYNTSAVNHNIFNRKEKIHNFKKRKKKYRKSAINKGETSL